MNLETYGGAYQLSNNQVWSYTQTGQRVPEAQSIVDPRTGVVQCFAPELLAVNMLDQRGVAELLSVNPDTVAKFLSEGKMPQPQVRIGKSPLWTRPVIEQWRATRPGKGANLRGRGSKAA